MFRDNHKNRIRLWFQIMFTALTNGYFLGFAQGKIFKGASKKVCVPGLNCYSCPGATGSCPIGALQAVLGNKNYNFSFYVIGFLMVVGSFFGRFVCGWLCPFGLFQELIHKIPFPKKVKTFKGEKWLLKLKYLVLIVFVIILPMFFVIGGSQGLPWFCKIICPSGTLMGGIPLVSTNPQFQKIIGGLFSWKIAVLLTIIFSSFIIERPFCKYICPLGAIYGPFNKFSLYQYEVDQNKCIRCNACYRQCSMNVKIYENQKSSECIRCGECKKVCPTDAISSKFCNRYLDRK